MIATRECLACGHENRPGAASCAVCSTSLNLKLCTACEAVNALAAEKCHDCGAALVEGVQVRAAPVEEVPVLNVPVLEQVEATEPLFEAALRRSVLPNPRPPVRTGRFASASLWLVTVALAAGGGYYFASGRVPIPVAVLELTAALQSYMRAEPPPPAPEVQMEPAPPPKPAKTLENVPAEPAKPAIAKAAPAPRRAPTPVTHTRTASTGTATAASEAPAAAVAEPAGPEAAGPEAAVSEAAAAPSYARVTHTKPSQTLERPVEPVLEKPIDNQPAACAPPVAALGLCPAK